MLIKRVSFPIQYVLLLYALFGLICFRVPTYALGVLQEPFTASSFVAYTVTDRLALLFSFFLLLLLLVSWMEAVHIHAQHGTPRFILWMKRAIFSFAIIYAVLQFAIILAYVASGYSQNIVPVYNDSSWLYTATSLSVVIVLVIYGVALLVLLRHHHDILQKAKVVIIIFIISVGYISSIAVRLLFVSGVTLCSLVVYLCGFMLRDEAVILASLFLATEFAYKEATCSQRQERIPERVLNTPLLSRYEV